MKMLIYVLSIFLLTTSVMALEVCGNGSTIINRINNEVYLDGWNFEPNCVSNWLVIGEINNVTNEYMIGYVKTSTTGTFRSFITNANENDNINFVPFEFYYGTGHSSNSYTEQSMIAVPEFTSVGYVLALTGTITILFLGRKHIKSR